MNLAETAGLAALASERGVTTMVGLQARAAPALHHLRALVTDGFVGRVTSTSLTASSGPAGPRIGAQYAYVFDDDNGANLTTVGLGHSIDALQWVLGPLESVAATAAVTQQDIELDDGTQLTSTAPDQIAVVATLASGAVGTVQFRPNRGSAGDGARWEIHGDSGALVVTSRGDLWSGALTVRGAQRGDAQLRELPVPAGYEAAVPALAGRSAEPAYNVAHAYAALAGDLRSGRHTVPDFAHGEALHRSLDTIRHAAATGRTLPLQD